MVVILKSQIQQANAVLVQAFKMDLMLLAGVMILKSGLLLYLIRIQSYKPKLIQIIRVVPI